MRVEGKPEFLKCKNLKIITHLLLSAMWCIASTIISAKLSLLTRIVPLVKTLITFTRFCTSALTIKISEALNN